MNKNNRLDKSIWYAIVAAALIMSIVLFFMSGCRTVYQPYPVPEVHTEHHYHTDSVSHTDSIIDHQTTIIRQVDSATMAEYGIRLAQAEKAWLIQSDKLYKEIDKLRSMKIDSVFVHDSIPYAVPGPKEYINELKWWQKSLVWWGVICTAIFAIILIIKIKFPKL